MRGDEHKSVKVGIIVHRFPPAIGGSERYAEVLANKLHGRGHEITVYTTKDIDRDGSAYPYDICEYANRIPESFGYFGWPGIFKPREFQSLRNQDVIHAIGADMFSAVVGALVNRIFGVPAVLTTFYHPPKVQTHQRLKRLYDRFILQPTLEQYDSLIVSSQYEREKLTGHFDLDGKQLEVMSIPSTAEASPATDFRGEFNLEDEFLVVYVGRLDSHKGMSTLLPAVEQVSKDIPSLRCIVVGETERWHDWPDDVAKIVDENRELFIFTGVRTGGELTAVYEAADVLVFPSQYETYGLITVEALSRRTPVVATPVGVAPELIEDGVNGYIYDTNDVTGLANRICDVWESDLDSLKSNAEASVASLSWETTISKMEDLYRCHPSES